MSGRRRTVLISVAVLGAVLPSCSSADPQGDAPATLADATTSASQSPPAGGLPGPTDPDDGNGPGGGQTGDQSGGATASESTGGRATPPAGSGTGRTAPPAGSGTGGAPPPPGSGSGGAVPPASSAAGSAAPPAGPAAGSSAPPADPGPARPGGEPAGGSSSAPRPGGAPPDADIIDRTGSNFPFSEFKAAQLAECGEYPNCVDVEIDSARSGPGAAPDWCAYETTPAPAVGQLDEFIQSSLPGRAVILVWVVPPLPEEDGQLPCSGQGPQA
jgi:hypothetical protein